MRTLIVEDSFVNRCVLLSILDKYGECHVAVNGKEALMAFDQAHANGKPYDLICLDIMMPEMDGHETLVRIREREHLMGKDGLDGVKVFMTTAMGDGKTIITSFREQCEAYLLKPIDKKKLLWEIHKMGLIQ
jgi:two-component system, chemotaxis family, chemotaxis protein CheY